MKTIVQLVKSGNATYSFTSSYKNKYLILEVIHLKLTNKK